MPEKRTLVESLRGLGLEVSETVLPRAEYFRQAGQGILNQRYHLHFMPKGVGDPHPDGAWQIAAKRFFPGLVDQARVDRAFFETDAGRRRELYAGLARELLRESFWLPLRVESDTVGVHKSLRFGDVAPFRIGITLHDLVPR